MYKVTCGCVEYFTKAYRKLKVNITQIKTINIVLFFNVFLNNCPCGKQAFRTWMQCYIFGLIQHTQYFLSRIMQRNPKAGIYIWEWLVWRKKILEVSSKWLIAGRCSLFLFIFTRICQFRQLFHTHSCYMLCYAKSVHPSHPVSWAVACFIMGQWVQNPEAESHHQYTTPVQLLLRIM